MLVPGESAFYDPKIHVSTGMSLFVVGSASHVGKSVTVAAICRCLFRRGIPVAPFKSHNMSLNSYVTREGGEIGMAQAMQAIAAKVIPDTDMNPILLKPKGECISQVVLHGHPYKDIHIGDYYKETPELLKKALESFERLKSKLINQGLAPATVKHNLVLIRQLINKSILWGMWKGENPVKKVKLPTLNSVHPESPVFKEG